MTGEQLPSEPTGRWRVWHQDTNGNQFRMPTPYETQEEAETVRDDFTSRGHHQQYWVEVEIKGEPAHRRVEDKL